MEQTASDAPTGLKEADFDALLSELVGNGSPRASEKRETGEEWDKLTLLTGGFVPVGSIFWARPPKLHSQQKILLAIDDADRDIEGESLSAGFARRSDLLCKLASELFYVRQDGEFRKATTEEIGGDEHGLDINEIKMAFFRLMGFDMTPDTPGNAESLPIT